MAFSTDITKALPKCSDCGRDLKSAIYDFEKKNPWCGPCFVNYLDDVKAARSTEGL